MAGYEVTNESENLSVWVEAENHQDAIEKATHIIEETDMTDLYSFEV